MAKYSYEFKKQIVMEYLEGHGGYDSLTAKYKLGTNSQLRRWVAAYNQFGDDGLKRSRQQDKYSFEKKLSVVELYLTTEICTSTLSVIGLFTGNHVEHSNFKAVYNSTKVFIVLTNNADSLHRITR